MGAAKLSLGPLKGHDEDTVKKQHAGSVEARINNDRAPHCKTRVEAKSVLLERKPRSDCQMKEQQ